MVRAKIIKGLTATLLVIIAAIGAAYFVSPNIKWRVDVLALGAGGQITGISFNNLTRMLMPGSGYWLEPLTETRNPYAAIVNPHTSPENISSGRETFVDQCAICHGSDAKGNTGPSLARETLDRGDSDWSIYKTIRDGLPGTSMVQSDLSEKTIWSVIAYIRSIQNSSKDLATVTNLNVPKVTADMITNSDNTPENWLTYSGQYNGQRFSNLTQINNMNASRVTIDWIHQFSGPERIQESSPIVVAGIMYVTEAPNTVHALDAATGTSLWTYSYRIPDDVIICCGRVNRGVAVYDNKVYMGTLDSHLIALDAANGTLLWDVQLHDYRLGSSITGAPLIVDGKVFIGYGGGDFGLRGFLDAVDATDGRQLWRLYTIPAEGEPGNESWSGDSWKTGGAPTWLTGSYDPSNDTLYWPIGNPGPDFRGDLRAGDNLYSNSILAINPRSGTIDWHFQFTPHDEHDWDANQIPILVDRIFHGQFRRLLLTANRNGFFYVLDRDTGEFLLAKEFAKQNWAHGIDAKGRPIINKANMVSAEGTVTWPSPIGATNWQSPTYSPETGFIYVPTLEFGQIVFKNPASTEHEPDKPFLGGYHRKIPGDDTLYFSVRALDPESGELVWEYRNPQRNDWWKTGGLVSTKGNILFGGDNTDVFFLDALSGDKLARINVGGRINASPITYSVNGTQYFAIAAGRSIIALSIPNAD